MTDASLQLPPAADRRPIIRKHHGREFEDPYEWLRDKDDPAVIAHLEAENAWTAQQTSHLENLRETLFAELRARTQETDLSVPSRLGAWWYYARTIEGQQYSLQARCPAPASDDWHPPVIAVGEPAPGEEVLLDLNELAEGHEFFSLGSLDITPEADRLVYAVDTEGDERYTLRIRDLASGQELPDAISNVAAGAVLDPSGAYLFYTTVDEAWRPDRVWRHTVGTSPKDDVVVLHEPDERYWVGVGLTRSRAFIQIEAASKVTSETWLVAADDPTGEPRCVWPRRDGIEYEVEHAVLPGVGDALVICHNANGANFEIVTTTLPGTLALDPADADVVIAHDSAVRLEDVEAFAGHIIISYRREALPRVGIVRLDEGFGNGPWLIDELTFDEPLFTVGTGTNPEFTQPTVQLSYTSFLTPARVLDHDVTTGVTTVLKVRTVLGGYDASDYVEERDWAVAADGTQIPISLVRRRDVDPAQPAPLVLYGYGSYEASIDPTFSTARLSLLDRGVVYGIAHVRGGGELGRHWYEQGRLDHKMTSFTDFVTCSEHLVATGRTRRDRLVGVGRSAGGLLMGAVANLAPESFAGIVADVPFVDALTSILDPSLPLTVIEWDEWGDPLHDEAIYDYMASYTPYENVRDGAPYPRILATTGLNDTRVLYVEPAKWVARLRDAGARVLLKTEMEAGHGGVTGRYAQWREVAFENAWILDVLGKA